MDPPVINPLLSTTKCLELHVSLHPLVLLSISDYITRHTIRRQAGPIVGALLGQNLGREVAIEHAFDCHIVADADVTGGFRLDPLALSQRLAQMKQVHKVRPLDLVGWWTLIAPTGPTPAVLHIHGQILALNEAAVVLGFHPTDALKPAVGGKLPLTIYDSLQEPDDSHPGDADGDDEKMLDHPVQRSTRLRFRPLTYSVEADEVEMISLDEVARDSLSAATSVPTAVPEAPNPSKAGASAGASPGPAADPATDPRTGLTQEDYDMLSVLTERANAIKMMQSRIQLLIAYLNSLPAPESAHGGDDDIVMTDLPTTADVAAPTRSHVILRQIQSLVGRLALLVPSDVAAFHNEMRREENDVGLIALVDRLIQSVLATAKVGKKVAIVEITRAQAQRQAASLMNASAGLF